MNHCLLLKVVRAKPAIAKPMKIDPINKSSISPTNPSSLSGMMSKGNRR